MRKFLPVFLPMTAIEGQKRRLQGGGTQEIGSCSERVGLSYVPALASWGMKQNPYRVSGRCLYGLVLEIKLKKTAP